MFIFLLGSILFLAIMPNIFSLKSSVPPEEHFHFIDVLYLCMQELLGEFDPATDLENTEFVEKVEDICSHLIYFLKLRR